MGPLHFILYINDVMQLPLNGSIVLYADDAVITYDCSDVMQLQQAKN